MPDEEKIPGPAYWAGFLSGPFIHAVQRNAPALIIALGIVAGAAVHGYLTGWARPHVVTIHGNKKEPLLLHVDNPPGGFAPSFGIFDWSRK